MTKKLQNALPLLVLVFGLLIAAMMFFNVLEDSDGKAIMTGLTATFGGTPYQFGAFMTHTVHFSFLNLLAFLLPAFISLIVTILVINHKKTSISKLLLAVILTFVFGLSFVLLLQLPENTKFTNSSIIGDITGNYSNAKLALSGILSYVFAILGTITSLIYTVLQFER